MRWMAGVLLTLVAPPVAAQPGEPLPVRALPSSPPTAEQLDCGRTGGLVASWTSISQLPVGQCITISGWQDGFTLAADLPSLYAPDASEAAGRLGVRIGLSGVNATYNDSGVRVVALIRDCADRRPGPGEAPDYCWFNSGRYLEAVQWRLEDQPAFRRVPLAVRPAALGNLARMADGEVADRLAAAAAPLWAAIAANDAGALGALLEGDDRLGYAVLAHAAQPAAARWTMGQPRVIVLGWRLPEDVTEEQQAGLASRGDIEGVVCAAGDSIAAAGLWPIDTRDTAVHRDRPYVCATIWLPEVGEPRRTMRHADMILPEPAP